jgi:hypothetical protein
MNNDHRDRLQLYRDNERIWDMLIDIIGTIGILASLLTLYLWLSESASRKERP